MVYPSSRRGSAEVHFAQNVKYWYMKYEKKKNAFLESEFHEGNLRKSQIE